MRNLIYLEAGDNMVFDGMEAVCWHIALARNVNTVRVRNISPGQLYTFIIEQDWEGGNTFAWTADFANAPAVDQKPHSTTIQNFIADTGGILRAHVPGTWNQEVL